MTESPETPETTPDLPDSPEAEPAAERATELESEVAKLKDQLLRALAEQENIRRRAQREREDAVKYAAQKFANDLLSAADNLRRALDSTASAPPQDEFTKTLLAGVAATERELLAAFEKHGIQRIDPAGEKFDHNLHQAMFELENTGKPAGTIVQVLAPGYVLQDRLLRAAMVGVAKGPVAEPAPEKDKAAQDKPDGYQRIDRTA
ncbi:MAG: nucleotide exchange factor GrpE [Aliidongia sp.]